MRKRGTLVKSLLIKVTYQANPGTAKSITFYLTIKDMFQVCCTPV